MIARMVRRWRVWRQHSRFVRHHHRMGYSLSASQDEMYREWAEWKVP